MGRSLAAHRAVGWRAVVVTAGYRYSQRWQSCAWRGQLVAAAVGCRDYWRLPRHSKHGPCMSRIFRIIVSVKVVVVCIVICLPWQRVFASEGVLLSESSVVTCESRPLYLSLSLRAWDCVASARRGLPPLGRKIYLLTYVRRSDPHDIAQFHRAHMRSFTSRQTPSRTQPSNTRLASNARAAP